LTSDSFGSGTGVGTSPEVGLRKTEDTEIKRGLDGIAVLAVLAVLKRFLIGAQNMKVKMSRDARGFESEQITGLSGRQSVQSKEG
jgi:hypothetical protein